MAEGLQGEIVRYLATHELDLHRSSTSMELNSPMGVHVNQVRKLLRTLKELVTETSDYALIVTVNDFEKQRECDVSGPWQQYKHDISPGLHEILDCYSVPK